MILIRQFVNGFSFFNKMENNKMILSEFQPVVSIKDNKMYAYKINENPYFLENDFALIKCYPIKKDGFLDLTNVIELYGKDLVSPD